MSKRMQANNKRQQTPHAVEHENTLACVAPPSCERVPAPAELDTMVRDFCAVGPKSKSEIRRRITDYAEAVAQQELEELNSTFDLMWEADMRAIMIWQKANPGNELVWPDRSKLTLWLIERAEAAERKLKETTLKADT